jgi:hypothetical protein
LVAFLAAFFFGAAAFFVAAFFFFATVLPPKKSDELQQRLKPLEVQRNSPSTTPSVMPWFFAAKSCLDSFCCFRSVACIWRWATMDNICTHSGNFCNRKTGAQRQLFFARSALVGVLHCLAPRDSNCLARHDELARDALSTPQHAVLFAREVRVQHARSVEQLGVTVQECERTGLFGERSATMVPRGVMHVGSPRCRSTS